MKINRWHLTTSVRSREWDRPVRRPSFRESARARYGFPPSSFAHLLGLALVASALCGCRSASTSEPCLPDRAYEVLLHDNRANRPHPSWGRLERSLALLDSFPERKVFLASEKGLLAHDFVRLEVTGPVGDRYEAVTLSRVDGDVILVGLSEGRALRAELSGADWQHAIEGVESSSPGTLYLGFALDGAVYLVSYRRADTCGQFALFAPLLSAHMPDDIRQREASVASEKALVSHLLRVLHAVTKTEAPPR